MVPCCGHERCRACPGGRWGRRTGLPRRRARRARARLRLGPAHRRTSSWGRPPGRSPGPCCAPASRPPSSPPGPCGPRCPPRAWSCTRSWAPSSPSSSRSGRGTCCASGPPRPGDAPARPVPPVALPPAGRRTRAAGPRPLRHRHAAGDARRGRGAVLARARPVDLRRPAPRRQAGGVRPAGQPGRPAAPGDRRLVRAARLLRPGADPRRHVHRRGRALADERRDPAEAGPRPGRRGLADVGPRGPPGRPVRRVPVARRHTSPGGRSGPCARAAPRWSSSGPAPPSSRRWATT